ncbi:MAG: 4Fe-4S binding protein [Ruminococcus sp.]|nr:4Fe-4S binding protein [Ruminococcus sp.]
MKRVYVNEQWCLGCHLCEYNCAFANSGIDDMVKALKGKDIFPRVHIEDGEDGIHFAVSCRHCKDPMCVKSCIAGAISIEDGVVKIDRDKCVGCLTCVLVCPYGAVAPGPNGAAQKCELCLQNSCGAPACVTGCPNNAIVYEER